MHHVASTEAIRTTVVPLRILIRTTVVPITPLIGRNRHDRRADKNPYRHDRNMRFSSKLSYALFSILMVSFSKLCFISVLSKHHHFNECNTRVKAFETKMRGEKTVSESSRLIKSRD